MNQASAALYSVREVPLLYKRLFRKELDFYDMVELLPLILKKTGSIGTKDFLFKGTAENFVLDMPCPIHAIKHVSDSRPISWYNSYIIGREALINYRVDQSGNIGAYNPDATQSEDIGGETTALYEVNKNVFTAPLGRMIDFTNDNNTCLHFNFKSIKVDVLYTGTVVDADGYPKVPDKTLEAIAHYMNYIDVRAKYNLKQADANQHALAEREKNQALAQARTPDALSVNEMDDLLNVLTSWNRKRHNIQLRK